MANSAKQVTLDDLQQIVRDVAEAQKKTEAEQQKTDAAIKELTKNINKATGDFNNKWGRFMETLIKGDLIRLLKEKNIEVSRIHQRLEYLRPGRIVGGEIDLVAIDGEVIVAFEIKSKLLRSDVKEFLEERVSKFTHHFPEFKGRTVYGGVGFLEAEEGAARYAEAEGLFVIKAGEGEAKVSAIINADDFIPKRFSE